MAAGVSTLVGSYGTLVLNSSGVYSYTYNTGIIHAITANVTDTFTYRVTDSDGDFADALVTINVAPVNDLPVAVAEPEEEPPGVRSRSQGFRQGP